MTLPFYELEDFLPKLAPGHEYLLYCERGTMSRLQAAWLSQRGFTNIRVYQPAGS